MANATINRELDIPRCALNLDEMEAVCWQYAIVSGHDIANADARLNQASSKPFENYESPPSRGKW